MDSFSDLCVYTIKHSEDLVEGRGGTFHENRPWTTARRLLNQSSRQNESVPIIFAEAERGPITSWRGAVLKEIQITEAGSDYTFSNLFKFKKPLRPKTVLRKRNGEPLSAAFIRLYAICRKPKFVG